MFAEILLPYGRQPRRVDLGAWPAQQGIWVVEPPPAPPSRPLSVLLDTALDAPIAAPRLENAVPAGARVVLLVSDATRDDPREAMLRALLARLPDDIELTLAVANGTHGPSELDQLRIPTDLWARAARVVNHDGASSAELVTIGTTRRGTPVKLHRCLTAADWILATGRIKPHYFAGYGAGCKTIFPGLGANTEIRINHLLKQEPLARAGVVDGNPCRDDLEEAVSLLGAQRFLLNVVLDDSGGAQAAVAGDIDAAFRAGARACAPLHCVRAPRADVVLVSDAPPVTNSLYQASKMVAAAAGLLRPGGTIIVAASCPEGVGPVDTVNRAIYDIGLAPRLPAAHRIVLVSDLPREAVAPSYAEWAPSVEDILARCPGEDLTILPRASSLIIEPAGP
ncbi:lactate racemase domain-containing protein [Haliangium sp.]|uniref:lactate racemase domain-containing protein n=1 Tax=Haliangium sp. TaxID=2663208 RepID=UPI003D1270DB